MLRFGHKLIEYLLSPLFTKNFKKFDFKKFNFKMIILIRIISTKFQKNI